MLCITLHTRPAKRCHLTAIAAVALVLGLLGTIYGVCGFTPLTHRIGLFHPLASWNTLQLSLFVSAWGSFTGVGVVAFVIIHRPLKPFVPLEAIEKLDRLSRACNLPKNHVQKVREFFYEGFAHLLDYHAFYYHLATLSESIASSPLHQEEGRQFLQLIDQKEIFSQENTTFSCKIDCHHEYTRLDGVGYIDLQVERLEKSSPEDLVMMNTLCREAFDKWGSLIRQGYFFENGNQPIVIRSGDRQEILALIVVQELKTEEGAPFLYIHTLTRKASAVKFGVTEKFKSFIQDEIDLKKFQFVYCEVLKTNHHAISIYQKMGFVFLDSEMPDAYRMIYRPTS